MFPKVLFSIPLTINYFLNVATSKKLKTIYAFKRIKNILFLYSQNSGESQLQNHFCLDFCKCLRLLPHSLGHLSSPFSTEQLERSLQKLNWMKMPLSLSCSLMPSRCLETNPTSSQRPFWPGRPPGSVLAPFLISREISTHLFSS